MHRRQWVLSPLHLYLRSHHRAISCVFNRHQNGVVRVFDLLDICASSRYFAHHVCALTVAGPIASHMAATPS